MPAQTVKANQVKNFIPTAADALNAERVLTDLAANFWSAGFLDNLAPQIFNRKKTITAEELPDLTSRYKILVEQIPAIVFMAFIENGLSEAYVSPHVERMLGFTQEEWLNDPVRWYQQIHPEDKARWSIEAAQTFLTGATLRSVYRVLARNGNVIWFQCEVRMVRREDGRPWFVHGVWFDITELKKVEEALTQTQKKLERHVVGLKQEISERKRIEHALTQSEAMFRGIFEFAPDTIILINEKGFIERVNSQSRQMFGYESTELKGKRLEILLPERLRKQSEKYRREFVESLSLHIAQSSLELIGKRRDGGEFPIEVRISPVSAESGQFLIIVIRDVTRRKRDETILREFAERQKELSRRLLEVQEAERRSIALELHDEIGQKLTGLKLALELGARQPEKSAESVAQAQTLVNELMNQTRQLSLALRPATLDHLGLLPALVWHFRNFTQQTNIEVEFNHENLTDRRFNSQVETTVYRVVQEALTNVARHAAAQSVKVRIWIDRERLTLQVEDHGKGFALKKVLAEVSSTGLTGMRERVALLGGDFYLESTIGTGTKLVAELNL